MIQAGWSYLNVIPLEFVDIFSDHTTKRHHNLGKISFGCFVHTPLAGHEKIISRDFQIGHHGFGPAHPGRVDVSRSSTVIKVFLGIFNRSILAFGGCHWKSVEHRRYGPGMILLRMVRDDKVNLGNAGQLCHQFTGFGRIHRVQQK